MAGDDVRGRRRGLVSSTRPSAASRVRSPRRGRRRRTPPRWSQSGVSRPAGGEGAHRLVVDVERPRAGLPGGPCRELLGVGREEAEERGGRGEARDGARATRGSPMRCRSLDAPAGVGGRLSVRAGFAKPRSNKPSAARPHHDETRAAGGENEEPVRMMRRGRLCPGSPPPISRSPPRASDVRKRVWRKRLARANRQLPAISRFKRERPAAHSPWRALLPSRLGRCRPPPPRGRRERGPADVHAFVGRVSASAADAGTATSGSRRPSSSSRIARRRDTRTTRCGACGCFPTWTPFASTSTGSSRISVARRGTTSQGARVASPSRRRARRPRTPPADNV